MNLFPRKKFKIKNKRKEWPHTLARERCLVGVSIQVACCCFVDTVFFNMFCRDIDLSQIDNSHQMDEMILLKSSFAKQ